MQKKRYCLVGTGSRSYMYIDALFGTFAAYGELKGICDSNSLRMECVNRYIKEQYGAQRIQQYNPDEFETMLQEQNADIVLVTSIDRTHHSYSIRAMQAGCDVITEKPMTIDCQKAEELFSTIKTTGKKLRVTFNYRYAPRNTKVKEILSKKVIGDITSIHFEWLLDTHHGADYFRRWHRDKRNSGGLVIHKASHHFDLVNWWLDSTPSQVFAVGNLVFYGKENAEARGVREFYLRGTDSNTSDPFALDLKKTIRNKSLYYDAESEDGYLRDQSVFSQGISIEDDIAVLATYKNNAVMSYHLTAYSPREGYRVCFNGTKGRLEFEVLERGYISGDDHDPNRVDVRGQSDFSTDESEKITVYPHWESPYEVEIPHASEGGHGGGDERLLHDVFVGVEDDPYHRVADHIQGANSILTGIAANESMKKNVPISILDMIRHCPELQKQLT